MITRHLFSKSGGKSNRNNGLGFRNGVKCIHVSLFTAIFFYVGSFVWWPLFKFHAEWY